MKSLVKKTVREFQRRHWYGRWPVLAFFVGPIALLVLAWIATALTLVAIGKTGELIGTPLPESSRDLSTIGLIILFGLVGWCFMVIPVGVAAILARLARRSSVSHLWVVVAAAMLGLSAGYIKCGFVPSLAGADHPFVMSIPLGLPFQSPSAFMAWYASSVQQAAQTLAPLATAVLLLARDLRIRSQTLKSVKHC